MEGITQYVDNGEIKVIKLGEKKQKNKTVVSAIRYLFKDNRNQSHSHVFHYPNLRYINNASKFYS